MNRIPFLICFFTLIVTVVLAMAGYIGVPKKAPAPDKHVAGLFDQTPMPSNVRVLTRMDYDSSLYFGLRVVEVDGVKYVVAIGSSGGVAIVKHEQRGLTGN